MPEARLSAMPAQAGAAAAAPAAWMPLLDAWVQLQQVQYAALASWQQALLAVQRELYDEWVCRWAGGVPIDA